MQYDPDAYFQSAAGLAAKGWKIVRLWGVRDNLSCTCGNPTCPNPGKHPHGGVGWPDRATDNESTIWSWFESVEEHTRCNIGVRLGPSSGVIDVEFDSPEGEAVLKQYGLHQIDTPTYKAGRGEHRIFQHEAGLPDSGVVKVDGLEVRLGGGESASQSVLPPSWHKTGVQYKWLPGKSPEDVNPAPLPEAFRQAVLDASKRRGSGLVAQARELLLTEEIIQEGNRHPSLVGIASYFASNFKTYTDDDRKILIFLLLSENATRCRPPKSRDEVIKIAKDQFAHYQQKQIDRRSKRPLEKHGLVYNLEDRCWEPGLWSLTIVKSDPAEYKLHIPHPENAGHRLTVRLDSKQIVNARDVAIAILEASKTINVLDPNPARWTSIWNGENIKDEDGGYRTIRGLQSKLFEDADHEIPPPEANVSVNAAGILYSYLAFGFSQNEPTGDESDFLPNHSGTPKWIRVKDKDEWELWFKWHDTIDAAWRKKSLQPPGVKERRMLKAMILEETGEKDFTDRLKRFGQGAGRWLIFTDKHIKALAKLSGAL